MDGLVRRILPRLVVPRSPLQPPDPAVTIVHDRHSYDREKREALEAWERRLREIVG